MKEMLVGAKLVVCVVVLLEEDVDDVGGDVGAEIGVDVDVVVVVVDVEAAGVGVMIDVEADVDVAGVGVVDVEEFVDVGVVVDGVDDEGVFVVVVVVVVVVLGVGSFEKNGEKTRGYQRVLNLYSQMMTILYYENHEDQLPPHFQE